MLILHVKPLNFYIFQLSFVYDVNLYSFKALNFRRYFFERFPQTLLSVIPLNVIPETYFRHYSLDVIRSPIPGQKFWILFPLV